MGSDVYHQPRRRAMRRLPLAICLACLALPLLLAACASAGGTQPSTVSAVPGVTPSGIYLMTATGQASDSGGTLRIAARNLSDGRERWHYTTDWSASALPSAPVVADGLVLLASSDLSGAARPTSGTSSAPSSGYLTALRASDGQRLWRVALGVAPSQPAVADGVVYVTAIPRLSNATKSKDVYALDAADGTVRWHIQLPADGTISDGLAVVGDTLVIAADQLCFDYCNGADLWALRTSDGGTRWKASITGNTGFSTPVVANGLVYEEYGVYGSKGFVSTGVFAYDVATGKERWHTLTYTVEHSGLEISTPVIVGDASYLTVGDPAQPGAGKVALVKRNSMTGAQVWRATTDPEPSLLAIAGQSLYVGAEMFGGNTLTGYTFAAYSSSDGHRIWRLPVTARMDSAAADATQVYAGNNPFSAPVPNAVTAYRASDGGTVWSEQTGGAATVLAAADGAVYVLHLPAGTNPGNANQPNPSLSALRATDGHVLFDQTLPGHTSALQDVVVVP